MAGIRRSSLCNKCNKGKAVCPKLQISLGALIKCLRGEEGWEKTANFLMKSYGISEGAVIEIRIKPGK